MVVDSNKCDQCMECISKVACPAIYKIENKEGVSIEIDPSRCIGCTVCVQACQDKAIRLRK